MLQLLHPIWLLAGAAVIIPVVLHLWNTRQGKVLQVGSVQLMQHNARQSSINLRLTDRWLLLLRCLLLLLLALLLAQPVWKSSSTSHTIKGWVVLEPVNSIETYTHFKPAIDSLLHAGFQLHYFQPGFAIADTATLAAVSNDTATSSYRTLLPDLLQKAPANASLYLYTSNRLNRFSGNRPVINRPVQWFIYTPADSIYNSIQQAWLTPGNKIKVALQQSLPSGNSYQYRELPAAAGQYDSFTLTQHKGLWQVTLNQQTPVTADTTTLSIALYTEEFPQDASYIQAAVEALRNFTNRRIGLIIAGNTPPPATPIHWLFWLSTKPVPASWQADNILQYHNGKVQAYQSYLQTSSQLQPISLYQHNRVLLSPDSMYSHWSDGYGQPILFSPYAQPHTFYFASRFNPAWSNITWNAGFPMMLARLLLPASDTLPNRQAQDKRAIDTIQLQPQVSSTAAAIAANAPAIPLSHLFWLLAAITLLAERILAHKTKGGQPDA